jgi:hypothetical protein
MCDRKRLPPSFTQKCRSGVVALGVPRGANSSCNGLAVLETLLLLLAFPVTFIVLVLADTTIICAIWHPLAGTE